MAVTLKDIANHVGVSKPTVTRILGGDAHYFKKETRDRVLQAARELGYRPNSAARAIASGRFNCITLLLGHDPGRSYLPVDLIYAIDDALTEQNMHLALLRLPNRQLTDAGFVPKALSEIMADGMIINYTHRIPTRLRDLIDALQVPVIWINTQIDHDCVYPDDFGGGRELTRHLIGLGHRQIAYVYLRDTWESPGHYSVNARRDGYRQAMTDAGLKPCVAQQSLPGREHTSFLTDFLGSDPAPTAIITYSDQNAAAVLLAAATLGRGVPHDLSVATFPLSYPLVGGLELGGMRVPVREEGHLAATMLLRKLAMPGTPVSAMAVPFPAATAGHTLGPAPGTT